MAEARRERVALAAAAASLVGSLAYVGQRLWEHTRGAGADPLLVLYDPHVAFHGRALAATWWAGCGFALAFALLRTAHRRARAVTLIERGSVPLALALVVLMLLRP